MTKMMTATQARKNFFLMLKIIETPGQTVTITHSGIPKGIFMSTENFEGWMETIDIMSNPEEVAEIEAGEEEVRQGKIVTFEEFKKKLGT